MSSAKNLRPRPSLRVLLSRGSKSRTTEPRSTRERESAPEDEPTRQWRQDELTRAAVPRPNTWDGERPRSLHGAPSLFDAVETEATDLPNLTEALQSLRRRQGPRTVGAPAPTSATEAPSPPADTLGCGALHRSAPPPELERRVSLTIFGTALLVLVCMLFGALIAMTSLVALHGKSAAFARAYCEDSDGR
jgi:hypothetical protein